MAVDNFLLINNTLFVTVPHVVIRHCNEMDAANTNEWLGRAGTTDESFCTASKGSFVTGELAYDEAQSAVDCTVPSEAKKNLQVR